MTLLRLTNSLQASIYLLKNGLRLVSHESETAEVKLQAEIADEVLKKAVEDQDYKVTSIE